MVAGFNPMNNPEMGGSAIRQAMLPTVSAMGRAPGAGLGGLGGGGADPQQLAMMLLGAGGAMGQAAAPSPYKGGGIGTALGAGLGGGLGGMMQYQAMQRDAKRNDMLDQILAQQAGMAGVQAPGATGGMLTNPLLGMLGRMAPGQNPIPFSFTDTAGNRRF